MHAFNHQQQDGESACLPSFLRLLGVGGGSCAHYPAFAARCASEAHLQVLSLSLQELQ